jgi:hypothetical protein
MFLIAVALGFTFTFLIATLEGFGCTVGDRPFLSGCSETGIRTLLLNSVLCALAALYVAWALFGCFYQFTRSSKG